MKQKSMGYCNRIHQSRSGTEISSLSNPTSNQKIKPVTRRNSLALHTPQQIHEGWKRDFQRPIHCKYLTVVIE